jgi:hypothetical protein
MGDPDTFCLRKNAALLPDVDAAIDRVVQQHPDWFILTDQNGPGGYKVLKPAEYYQGVTASLQSAGFCAETDTVSVSVRNGIDFSEDYDILLGTGHVRRGQGSYRQTCTPPSFPLDASQLISYIRVAFYSIRCPEGVAVPRNAEDRLPLGCTGFVTATPKTKDNLDVKQGLIGTQIDWTFEQEGEHVPPQRLRGRPLQQDPVRRQRRPLAPLRDGQGLQGLPVRRSGRAHPRPVIAKRTETEITSRPQSTAALRSSGAVRGGFRGSRMPIANEA